MPDQLRELLQHGLPFMVAASSEADKVNLTRIVEAVLIAALTGLGAWLLIIPELKTEMRLVSDDLKAVSVELRDIEKRVDSLSVEVVRDRFTRTDFENWRANYAED